MTERVTPKQSRAEKTKEKILEVARQVYLEKGLEFTTTAVSEGSGVSIGTIYRYFSSRVELMNMVKPEEAPEAPVTPAIDTSRLDYLEDALTRVRAIAAKMIEVGEGKGDLKAAGEYFLQKLDA